MVIVVSMAYCNIVTQCCKKTCNVKDLVTRAIDVEAAWSKALRYPLGTVDVVSRMPLRMPSILEKSTANLGN